MDKTNKQKTEGAEEPQVLIPNSQMQMETKVPQTREVDLIKQGGDCGGQVHNAHGTRWGGQRQLKTVHREVIIEMWYCKLQKPM